MGCSGLFFELMIPPHECKATFISRSGDKFTFNLEGAGRVVIPRKELWEPIDLDTLVVGEVYELSINGWWWYDQTYTLKDD